MAPFRVISVLRKKQLPKVSLWRAKSRHPLASTAPHRGSFKGLAPKAVMMNQHGGLCVTSC